MIHEVREGRARVRRAVAEHIHILAVANDTTQLHHSIAPLIHMRLITVLC
jgi:hypothetical protein